MKIRKATKKDLGQISKVVKTEFDRIFKEKWSDSTSIQFVKYFYKIGIIYIAEDKQKILGFIIGRLEPIGEGMAMVVEGLAVDSKYQKKGIGSLLVKKLEEYAKSKKVYLTYLTTRKGIPAVKFYEKMKFKKSKDVVILGKRLR